jgi:2-polyprenyl-3-methyl-5-hydroxy-6-metoxy-1,4-benzoquinol methylase
MALSGGSARDWATAAAQNREAWEEVADVRVNRWSNRRYTAELFAAGGCSLDDRVVEALGDVYGKRALHLMCATGEDSLALAVLGARVLAVDVSRRQIGLATNKARAAGLPVKYIAADVGDLPPVIAEHGFDLVDTGGGVLVWVPDVEWWAKAITDALRPGGRFEPPWDFHPLAMRRDTVDGELRLESFAAGRDARVPKYEFTSSRAPMSAS